MSARPSKNPITRRTFNSAVALASMAVAAPFVHTRRARARESADVIVIGAGLSGLNAAWILSEAGADVLVLEGSNRIGGRVWSADEKWVTNAGEVPIELGASQVGPSYARVLYAIDRLKLPTLDEDRTVLPFAYHLDGTLIKGSEWPDSPHNRTVGDEREVPAVQFAAAMLARLNPLNELDDWLDPRFSDHDVSIHDLLARHGVSEGGIRLAGHQSDLHGVSALRLFQEQTRGSFEQRFGGALGEDGQPLEHWPKNLAGGTVALPLAMAGQLPREVRLGQQVTAIEVEPDAVDVRTLDGGRYRARFAVAATPFTVLRDVSIWPRPPEPQFEAIRRLNYAETTRAFCRIREPFWQEDGYEPSLFSDGAVRMFWTIDNHRGEGEYRGMFVLTNAAGKQVAARPPESAVRFLIEEMERIRPASRGRIEILRYHSWERQPLQRGCSPMFAPGQVTAFANEMILPHGRLHFAGEHTRRLDYGMEAAMEAGERAALEILDRI
ncbi:MAG: NAD(P)-binding protein [Gammaproteobacteria bacterium]|nr:NAD(P)-binding protein [Gammaproteobacteria bacterium]MYF68280.1 NAD(P)-binding protein [Gammaproteobacteria bacterium]MYK38041.1 NAD(P)-binding protein [Gammaproteobacteria bacterium]